MAPTPMPAERVADALPDAEGRMTQGVRNFGNQKRMISELERINALNLEPSLPKVDDGNRTVSKYWQDRDKVKNEFQQFLTVMKKNDEQKAGGGAARNGAVVPSASSSTRKPLSKEAPATTGAPGKAPLALQPGVSSQSAPSLGPQFLVEACGPLTKNLPSILEDMLAKASATIAGGVGSNWPEAKGPSYHDVLGQPTGKAPELQGMANDPAAPEGGSSSNPRGGGGRQNQEDNMPRNRQGGNQGNNSRQGAQQGHGHDQMRAMNPGQQHPGQQHHQQGPPGQQGGPQGGYVMGGMQGGGQGQQQMMFQMPGGGMGQGPQGMPMQGMAGMQGQQMMQMMGQQPGMQGQMMGMMPGPNGQMVPMGMMQGPGQSGPNGQGGPNMQQFGNDQQQQQQQQMMFMQVMMPADGQGGMMMPQGMQGYPGQQPGGSQQGGFMMAPQPMYNPQAQNEGKGRRPD